MLGKNLNPKLAEVEQAQQAKVKPEMKSAFDRIVLAGETLMFSPKTAQLRAEQFKQKGDPVESVATGVAKLMGLLLKQSKGSMPMPAAMPAATVLLCEALDFAEKAGMLQVSPPVIAHATQVMFASFLQLIGVTPQKLQMLMHKTQAQPPQPGDQPAQTAAAAPSVQPAGGLVAQTQGAPA